MLINSEVAVVPFCSPQPLPPSILSETSANHMIVHPSLTAKPTLHFSPTITIPYFHFSHIIPNAMTMDEDSAKSNDKQGGGRKAKIGIYFQHCALFLCPSL